MSVLAEGQQAEDKARIVIQALATVPGVPINHSDGHEHDQQ